jgi:hypothetical protein
MMLWLELGTSMEGALLINLAVVQARSNAWHRGHVHEHAGRGVTMAFALCRDPRQRAEAREEPAKCSGQQQRGEWDFERVGYRRSAKASGRGERR